MSEKQATPTRRSEVSWPNPPGLARTHHAFGQALESGGRTDEAEKHLREAERLFEELGIRPDPVIA